MSVLLLREIIFLQMYRNLGFYNKKLEILIN